MNPEIFSQPFVQITLPILVGVFIPTVVQNRGFDGINRRVDDVGKRFDELKADMNGRFDRADTRIDALTGKVNEIDNRVIRIEDKLGIVPR